MQQRIFFLEAHRERMDAHVARMEAHQERMEAHVARLEALIVSNGLPAIAAPSPPPLMLSVLQSPRIVAHSPPHVQLSAIHVTQSPQPLVMQPQLHSPTNSVQLSPSFILSPQSLMTRFLTMSPSNLVQMPLNIQQSPSNAIQLSPYLQQSPTQHVPFSLQYMPSPTNSLLLPPSLEQSPTSHRISSQSTEQSHSELLALPGLIVVFLIVSTAYSSITYFSWPYNIFGALFPRTNTAREPSFSWSQVPQLHGNDDEHFQSGCGRLDEYFSADFLHAWSVQEKLVQHWCASLLMQGG